MRQERWGEKGGSGTDQKELSTPESHSWPQEAWGRPFLVSHETPKSYKLEMSSQLLEVA